MGGKNKKNLTYDEKYGNASVLLTRSVQLIKCMIVFHSNNVLPRSYVLRMSICLLSLLSVSPFYTSTSITSITTLAHRNAIIYILYRLSVSPSTTVSDQYF